MNTEIAEWVDERTSGHPALVQGYGHFFVQRLNAESAANGHQVPVAERRVTEADKEPTEVMLLERFAAPLGFNAADAEGALSVSVDDLVDGAAGKLSRADRRWLERRLMIDEAGEVVPAAFRRWLLEFR